MTPSSSHRKVITVSGITNQEFLENYAAPGRVGLSGGTALADRLVRRAERHVNKSESWSRWSHAFLIGERRTDGHLWVLESNLQVHRKRMLLGVQENRITMYHDESLYPVLAVLDFGLDAEKVDALIREGLNHVASRTRYSIRELFGTLLALRHPHLRAQENLLARERSIFCSAFVQLLFRKAGLDLNPGVALKNTTPEDIASTSVPHVAYVLDRHLGESRLREMARRIKARVRRKTTKLQDPRR